MRLNCRSWLLIWLVLSICLLLQAETSGLSFETEQLSFTLQDSLWYFEGDFGFFNSSPQKLKQTILFPVLEDSLQSRALHVTVTAGEDNSLLPVYNIGPKGFCFALEMQPESFQIIRICYRQKLKAKQASYVLLTTLSWGKALAYGSYRVSLPQDVKLIRYPFGEPAVKQIDGKNVYYWEFYDFLPQGDFELAWD